MGDRSMDGITNIGRKPTVDGTYRGVETYLYNVKDEDLYGEKIRVLLLKYVRPEKKFESLDLLKEQICRDIASGREFFGEQGIMDRQCPAGTGGNGHDPGRNDPDGDAFPRQERQDCFQACESQSGGPSAP